VSKNIKHESIEEFYKRNQKKLVLKMLQALPVNLEECERPEAIKQKFLDGLIIPLSQASKIEGSYCYSYLLELSQMDNRNSFFHSFSGKMLVDITDPNWLWLLYKRNRITEIDRSKDEFMSSIHDND